MGARAIVGSCSCAACAQMCTVCQTSRVPTSDPDFAKTVAALTAAQLYYMQDLTMEAIAAELGTSRSSVSRLLSFARDSGLVDIQIRSPFERGLDLEQAILARHRVVAHVVPMPESISDVDRLERVERQSEMDAAELLGLSPWIPTLKYRWVRIRPTEIAGRLFSLGPEPARL